MTERIDHAAQAVSYLHPESYQPEKAQVHATLALVEQQRITNLIAYLSADVLGGGAGSNGAIADIEEAVGIS